MIHRHRWVAVAVDAGVRAKEQATAVLYRCAKCGKVKTDTLTGAWSLDQLTDSSGRPEGGA